MLKLLQYRSKNSTRNLLPKSSWPLPPKHHHPHTLPPWMPLNIVIKLTPTIVLLTHHLLLAMIRLLANPTRISENVNGVVKKVTQWVSHCPTFKNQFPSIQVPTLARVMPPSSPATFHAPQAHVVTASTPSSCAWVLGSGASHHVTNDLANLSLHAPYDSTERKMA